MIKGFRLRAFLTKPIQRPPTVVRVVLAIVLGVATTVAVAWGLAYFVKASRRNIVWIPGYSTEVALQVVPAPPRSPQQTGVHFASVVRRRQVGTDLIEVWPVWADDGRPPSPPGSTHALVEGTSFAAEMKEKFDRGEAPTAQWRADGWPFRALSAEARWWGYDATGLEKVVGGMLVGSRHVLPKDGVRILPMQPMWTGFVIDSLLYASLWFGIFLAWGHPKDSAHASSTPRPANPVGLHPPTQAGPLQ